ncbi:transmembrane protein 156 [Leptodactylus fuscus]|uniref:transmembrane protein 156 n=1 Tax=Leptodactylus fuscus TaxID=238119 RepID=UPI003F4ED842
MTASLLLKLFIGITVLLIVCIPEGFKTKEGVAVGLSCIDPCMADISYITSIICLLEEDENEEDIETVTAEDAVLSSIRLGFSMNYSDIVICHPPSNPFPLLQEVNVQRRPINVSLNIKGKYFHYSDVELNFIMEDSQEEESISLPSWLEIHISNLTRHNRTRDQLLDHRDFINVSLHYERPIPFYTRPLGIVWLTLISLVFICGLIFIVYKVKQEEKNSHFIDYNQARSSIQRLNEEHNNISSKQVCHKEDMCKWEGQKTLSTTSILPIITEQQDTVYK